MTTIKLRNLTVLAACLGALACTSVASAQSARHDWMDARAARKDIRRLQVDRNRAVRYHNWGKVAQDDRLIASDRYWIHKDIARARKGGG